MHAGITPCTFSIPVFVVVCMNGGDTKLRELSGFYKMQKSQRDFLILPVATLVGLDDATVVVTS